MGQPTELTRSPRRVEEIAAFVPRAPLGSILRAQHAALVGVLGCHLRRRPTGRSERLRVFRPTGHTHKKNRFCAQELGRAPVADRLTPSEVATLHRGTSGKEHGAWKEEPPLLSYGRRAGDLVLSRTNRVAPTQSRCHAMARGMVVRPKAVRDRDLISFDRRARRRDRGPTGRGSPRPVVGTTRVRGTTERGRAMIGRS